MRLYVTRGQGRIRAPRRAYAGAPPAVGYARHRYAGRGVILEWQTPPVDQEPGRLASLEVTLAALTNSATGQLLIKGAASQTLAALTLNSAGTLGTLTTGSLAATLANATLSSAGKLQIQAALAKTLGAVTSASAGTLRIAGQASQTLAPLSLSSTGTGASPIAGALGVTLGNLVLSSAGGESITVWREVRAFASPICQAIGADSYITTAVTLTSTIDIEATT